MMQTAFHKCGYGVERRGDKREQGETHWIVTWMVDDPSLTSDEKA